MLPGLDGFEVYTEYQLKTEAESSLLLQTARETQGKFTEINQKVKDFLIK